MAFNNVQDAQEMYLKHPDMLIDLSGWAYLIEFLDSSDAVKDSFTFSLPPESEEFNYSFRKTETKLFGGTHIDEYGMDEGRFVIQGSTANQRFKKVRVGKDKTEKYLTGEQEIFMLRDLLVTYKKEIGNSKKIRLTDLSKSPSSKDEDNFIQKLTNKVQGWFDALSDFQGINTKLYTVYQWIIYPGEFRISRDKSKPFTYNYYFEFTAADPQKNKGDYKEHKNLLKLLDEMQAVLDDINALNAAVQNTIGAAFGFADNLRGVVDKGLGLAKAAADMLTEGAHSIVDGLIDTKDAALSIPQDVMSAVYSVGEDAVDAWNKIKNEIEITQGQLKDIGEGKFMSVPKSLLDKLDMDSEDLATSCIELEGKYEEKKSAVLVIILLFNQEINVCVETKAGDGGQEVSVQNRVYYGNRVYQLRDGDTLEGLALQEYGSLDYMADILRYNEIGSVYELEPGQKLLLPVVNPALRQSQDIVSYDRRDRDNYGKDIRVDDEGNLVIKGNDFAVTSGVRNLNQAILLRLRESLSKRMRLNTYGIIMNLGSGRAANNYILSSIYQTIASDPRVSMITGMTYQGIGDSLAVDVEYIDINNNESGFSGKL
jgi:hypothetical protein